MLCINEYTFHSKPHPVSHFNLKRQQPYGPQVVVNMACRLVLLYKNTFKKNSIQFSISLNQQLTDYQCINDVKETLSHVWFSAQQGTSSECFNSLNFWSQTWLCVKNNQFHIENVWTLEHGTVHMIADLLIHTFWLSRYRVTLLTRFPHHTKTISVSTHF